MNDSPEMAYQVAADGVHVGQDDVSVARCRELLGAEAIVGLSTHSNAEFDDALTQRATYFSAGPIVQHHEARSRRYRPRLRGVVRTSQ